MKGKVCLINAIQTEMAVGMSVFASSRGDDLKTSSTRRMKSVENFSRFRYKFQKVFPSIYYDCYLLKTSR